MPLTAASTLAPVHVSSPAPTPRKKTADDEDTLPVLIGYHKCSISLDSQNTEDKLEELCKKFVGEIDLPENMVNVLWTFLQASHPEWLVSKRSREDGRMGSKLRGILRYPPMSLRRLALEVRSRQRDWESL
ncbi:uncharacterized protein F5891DRAFT_986465 [Suillus fuscotomentosus]|uniref:Uncharacterized protein n=1 Tax=Suillus fuscotomentosus TaxID=1912939 RepID=A0AAD4DRP5_9AGAM|nr:uncharacterized protein F5891DRAFT_986465 [Suillus fuscotomentosus]KAG1891835.1 hypothetical protein F5891DRAFT_986465 [Suillus fuscotomentosus]